MYIVCVCSKDHSRQAFTTSVIVVVIAVSIWSVREPQGLSRLMHSLHEIKKTIWFGNFGMLERSALTRCCCSQFSTGKKGPAELSKGQSCHRQVVRVAKVKTAAAHSVFWC